MMAGGDKDSIISDINVTPFVDVMLVLLIIFMATAPMMVQGVNVSLPEATTKPLVSEKEHLLITLDKGGNIYINDYKVAPEQLQVKIKKILEGHSGQEVYLRADKNISYGAVVTLMSEIKEAGVEKLGMVTEPIESKTNRKK
ncbi:MAG: protein TolR [Proteobacteria bacterium]|nr:protein TolR [Pseudomonadota bacterium]